MGNCCLQKQNRYSYVLTKTWYQELDYGFSSPYQSSADSVECRMCHKRITMSAVLARCNLCKSVVGHASCIYPDDTCIICLR